MFDKFVETIEKKPLLRMALIAAPTVATKAWAYTKRVSMIEMRFNSEMADYDAVVRYVTENIIDDRRSRTYSYQTEARWDREEQDELVEHHGLTAGYGEHKGRYGKTRVLIDRSLDTEKKGRGVEYLNLAFITRNRAIVRQFADDIAKEVGKTRDNTRYVQVHINSGTYWERMGRLPVRRIDSVITRNNAGEQIIDAIREFEARKEDNHRMGLPHHMGIMLHGAPGCGKSSLVHAVASELGRSIHYLNLGSIEKDSELTSLLSGGRNWNERLLVIEDIDAAGVKVNRASEAEGTATSAAASKKWWQRGERTPEPAPAAAKETGETTSPVSLSALLNVLDGILCPDGLVVIATTNHHQNLDPALRRAGRFDQTVCLDKLNYSDFLRMAALLGKDPSAYPVKHDLEMSGADMRAMLLGITT